ncbi:MAG: hypothetical protein IPM37_16005 [Hahellaceae bacterium]|nr:hypothetical protein [Hahellaceae bacterium]
MNFNEWAELISNRSPAIYSHMSKFVEKGFDIEDGNLRVYRRLWVGDRNYLFTFFQGFDGLINLPFSVASYYIDFLKDFNGCLLYGLQLFGVAQTTEDNLIDYSKFQAQDIIQANRTLKKSYKNVPEQFIYFGVRPYSFSENVGYFIEPSGGISGYLKSNEVIGKWRNLEEFLQTTLEDAKNFESRMGRLYSN